MTSSRPHVAVAHPGSTAYSETFIQDHLQRLPRVETVLRNGFYPKEVNGSPVLWRPTELFHRAIGTLGQQWGQQLIDVWKQRRLSSLLQKRGVDVVLAEYGPTGVHVWKACQRAQIPLVVHFHGQDTFHQPMVERYAREYREMFQYCSACVVGTNEMREALVQLGASPGQLRKNPCGVDVGLFQPCDPASNPPRFVAVGRFVEKKAPHLTLLAFSRVLEKEPGAQFIIIGEGDLLAACKQLVQALGIEGAVTFTGAVPHEEVVRHMRRARAFVQHSVRPPSGDSEGTSISVLEGAASGLPVVATRHGGIKDSVIDGETGFLVDEYDVEAMAQRMMRLCSDPERAASLGRSGRHRMEKTYRMEKSIEGLYDILLEACTTVE